MRDVHGKCIAVVGLASSGLAAVELLRARGAELTAVDAKPLANLGQTGARLAELGVEFRRQYEAQLETFDLVVVSPGVPFDLPALEAARARGVAVVGDVEAASWYLRGPILGITGANGKTTTTALVGHLLQTAGIACQVGGNIGRPLAALVETSREGQWNVLELSSFQLEAAATLRVHIGAVLNITPDHLDRHHTFEKYTAAKAHIFANQTTADHAVLNAEDAPAAALAEIVPGQVTWFDAGGEQQDGFYCRGAELMARGAAFMPAAEVPLRGRHNIENVLAGAACAHLAGARLEQIRAGVASFPGVEHRIEYVRTVNGVAYYNDSKATNVDATLKAVASFSGGVWIILGGKDKDSDYQPLREPLAQKAPAALLIGAAAEKIAAALHRAVPLARCGTLEAAVRYAHECAHPGDTVLLSPACASFDQFENYEQRGRVFKTLVAALKEQGDD